MSKRSSMGSGNTLFKYFTKTPPAKQVKNEKVVELQSPQTCTNHNNSNGSPTQIVENEKKRKREDEGDSAKQDVESPIGHKKKFSRLLPMDSDSDSDTENKADNKKEKSECVSVATKLANSFKFEPKSSPPSSPKPQKKKEKEPVSESPRGKQPTQDKPPSPVCDDENWTHCRLDWLKPHKIRDSMKRRPDHPDYDPKTLFVPDSFRKEQTPAHRQWWDMKATNFDCVLFFKVGKFYELFHMDAAVGVNELGFSYMRGEFAHSGFPESAYARMASTLVSKGYKVARVEQTETPEMMQERCKRTGQNTKFDKVVRREICQLTCKGTEVCGLQDGGPTSADASFMMAIAEQETGSCDMEYGVCFIDTSIGLFNLGQFKDDRHCSRLLTTLAHYPPALVIYEKRAVSSRTKKFLDTHCYAARKETFPQFCAPDKTLKLLAEKYYRTDADGEWPEGLKAFLHEGDSLGLTPTDNCSLAIKALGGCVSYLTEARLDLQLLEMAQFTAYTPPDVQKSQMKEESGVWEGGNTMVLDAITLRNLRVIGEEGCLYDKLNHCATPMGKRSLHQWICSPSCNISVIKDRQIAVSYLMQERGLAADLRTLLASLPDLERLLAKMHSLGNLRKSKDHPDSRAIFYEEKTYTKRKILDFVSVLKGLEAATQVVDMFASCDSPLLKMITQFAPNGRFPDYSKTITFFKEAFNHAEAEKEGRIVPGQGVDAEYDGVIQRIAQLDQELKEYLKEQEKHFKSRVTFVGADKKRYQLEVSESAAKRVNSDYSLEGARKGYKRYSTPQTKEFLSQMLSAEDQKRGVLSDLSRRILEKFSSSYWQWEAAVQALATLDVLQSFAHYALTINGSTCMPQFTLVDRGCKPWMRMEEGRHPCIPLAEDYIPNSVAVGGDVATLLLLTGPNMGGKSTLMRQAGLLTLMAHLGCPVPADSFSLSPVDRIFTRLGASDDILSAQSTFLVEMNEAAAILHHASQHSLVLIDELGRGTSTYDGTAIAAAVVDDICGRDCRTIFSTHYHSLVQDFSHDPRVALVHMSCMVETDETSAVEGDDIVEESITFLYKMSAGACPKSYGFNAARLAGVPRDITRTAQRHAKLLEDEAEAIRTFKAICRVTSEQGDDQLRELIASIKI